MRESSHQTFPGYNIAQVSVFYGPFAPKLMQDLSTGAENVRWDLSALYSDAKALRADLEGTEQKAEAFSQAYRGRVATLDASGLHAALVRLEAIQERAGRAGTYAYLNWATATLDPGRGRLLQHVREACNRISQLLLFFELEWVGVETRRVDDLLAESVLNGYRHYLKRERLFKDHILSEPEEKILTETSVTGRSAWMRFFTETMGGMRFSLRGEDVTQEHVLAQLHESDRALRRDAALAFTEGLSRNAHALTYIFNTLLAEKASRDRLRKFPRWITARNLSNEITDQTADALIAAVTERYDLVARFYTLKRQILKLEELVDYDRYAPVVEKDRRYSWEDARSLTLESYGDFHPRMREVAELFFEGRWIDAPVVAGKQGGAFSHGAVPSAHPYVLLNYNGRPRDVQTLAHELGHGVHQYLARERGYFQAGTPLVTAETASVFGEMLVFQRLLANQDDPAGALALLVSKIDDSIATVFRQVAMNRFEDRAHTLRREVGELSSEAFAEHWLETQNAMFQGSVRLGEHYRHWWSYVPHFLHTPGYVYAYAFGELLVLALYAQYEKEPDTFPDRYLELLAAGGSEWPRVLVGRLGLDWHEPTFWKQGLGAIEALIERAEQCYADAL